MDYLGITKKIATGFVALGVTAVVKSTVKNNTSPGNLKERVAIGVGTYVISAMITNASRQFTSDKLDDFIELTRKVRKSSN